MTYGKTFAAIPTIKMVVHMSTKHRISAELRYRYPYIGKPRHKIGGHPEPQRLFALPPGALNWTMDDQAEAVSRGYFVQRSWPGDAHSRPVGRLGADNHAMILPLADGRYGSDVAILNDVEASAFHRDPHAAKLLAFIEQQDSYGYSGAWDVRIERLTGNLRWYKARRADERREARKLTEHGRAMARRRWDRRC